MAARAELTYTEPAPQGSARHSLGLCVPSLTEPPAMGKGSPGAQLFSLQAFVGVPETPKTPQGTRHRGPATVPRAPAADFLAPS